MQNSMPKYQHAVFLLEAKTRLSALDGDFSIFFAVPPGEHHVDDAHCNICKPEYKKLSSVLWHVYFPLCFPHPKRDGNSYLLHFKGFQQVNYTTLQWYLQIIWGRSFLNAWYLKNIYVWFMRMTVIKK